MKEFLNIWDNNYEVAETFNDFKTIFELKHFLPIMEKSLYTQLKEDIRINNVRDAILYFKLPNKVKLVVEGHTRLRAAIETGKETIPAQEITEDFKDMDDIKFWMIKNQFNRRNLSMIDKIRLIFPFKSIIVERAKKNLIKGGSGQEVVNHVDTDFELAKLAGVSKSTISRYSKIIKLANDDLIDNVHKGKISIRDAANQVRMVKSTESYQQQIKIEKYTIEELLDAVKNITITNQYIESDGSNYKFNDDGIKWLEKEINNNISHEKIAKNWNNLFREIIKDQIDDFKLAAFNNVGSKTHFICSQTKLNFERRFAHVDHVYPLTFDSVYKEFIRVKNINLDEVNVINNNLIADEKIREDFWNFHKERAILRLVCIQANSQGNRTNNYNGNNPDNVRKKLLTKYPQYHLT